MWTLLCTELLLAGTEYCGVLRKYLFFAPETPRVPQPSPGGGANGSTSEYVSNQKRRLATSQKSSSPSRFHDRGGVGKNRHGIRALPYLISANCLSLFIHRRTITPYLPAYLPLANTTLLDATAPMAQGVDGIGG